MATFLPLIGVAALVLVGAAIGRGPWRRWWDRVADRRRKAELATRTAARIAELAADPARAPYAEKIAAGEFWSDEQIAYDLDPGATCTCKHLAPIERAMRRAGVSIRITQPLSIAALCRIDAAALARTGQLAPPADYREYYHTGRFEDRSPMAAISCLEHPASVINVLHPDDAEPDTPLFDGVVAAPVR